MPGTRRRRSVRSLDNWASTDHRRQSLSRVGRQRSDGRTAWSRKFHPRFLKSFGSQRSAGLLRLPPCCGAPVRVARAPGVIASTSNYPEVDEPTVCGVSGLHLIAASESSTLVRAMTLRWPAGTARQIQILSTGPNYRCGLGKRQATSGAEQAIDLSVEDPRAPGLLVFLEQPGATRRDQRVAQCPRPHPLDVPLEHDGGRNLKSSRAIWLVNRRASSTRTRPFSTLTGVTTSDHKRRQLLTLRPQFGAVILEDDHSPEFSFAGATVPAIRGWGVGECCWRPTRFAFHSF